MSKKEYKQKRSKGLTKQRKLVADPEAQKSIDSINHDSGVWNKKKKKA